MAVTEQDGAYSPLFCARTLRAAIEGQIESVDDLRKGERQLSPWLPRVALFARRRSPFLPLHRLGR